MLFRVVRPMKRDGSRIPIFVQRIPADIMSRAVGTCLAISLGDGFTFVTVSARAQSIRFSLRTADPARLKAVRQSPPRILKASGRHSAKTLPPSCRTVRPPRLLETSTASGRTARIAPGSIAIEQKPGGGWQRVSETQAEQEAHWAAIEAMWEQVGASGDPADLEKPLGPLVDRLLLSKGIRRVDDDSRSIVLSAFWMALRDAFASRRKNIEGDYSDDPKAEQVSRMGGAEPRLACNNRVRWFFDGIG